MVKAIIRFSVSDIKTFLTKISQPTDVLIDTTGGMIRDIVEETNWEDIVDLDEKLTREVGGFIKVWGISVDKVTLTNLQIANSIRIIQDEHSMSRNIPIDQNYVNQ